MRGLAAGVALALVSAAPAAAQTQLPRAHITSGPAGETTETSAGFTFEASGTAPLGSFECRLDGGPWASCTSPKDYRKLTGGPHLFQVRLTGPLTDPTPDERRWIVAQRTEVTPPPLPPPPPPEPPRPPDSPDRPQPPEQRPQAPEDHRTQVRRDAFGCAFAGNRPGEFHDVILERATICVINHQRRKRDLRPVRRNAQLQAAAARHARDMVRRRYFSHESLSGSRVFDRVSRSGYLTGASYWTLAEVLAWRHRPAPSPAVTVRMWMRSPGHKHALLLPSVRDVGVAVVHGTPAGNRDGATWAANIARRG
jgi:uncharacterized protein YkwD